MCIIITCPPLIRPSEEIVDACWKANDDGGGLMYPIPKNKAVKVDKGHMTLASFKEAISKVPNDVPLVLHFRIGTAGGNIPALTHPFTVTNDCAIAHNGILAIRPHAAAESDTSTFVTCVLRHLPRGWQLNPGIMYLVEEFASPGNKFAIMDASGTITRTNESAWNEHEGMHFSNHGWRTKTPIVLPSYSLSRYGSGDGSEWEWPDVEHLREKAKPTKREKKKLARQLRVTLAKLGYHYAPATDEWFDRDGKPADPLVVANLHVESENSHA